MVKISRRVVARRRRSSSSGISLSRLCCYFKIILFCLAVVFPIGVLLSLPSNPSPYDLAQIQQQQPMGVREILQISQESKRHPGAAAQMDSPIQAVENNDEDDNHQIRKAVDDNDLDRGARINHLILDRKKTGPTPMAYVLNFEHARNHPEFLKKHIANPANRAVEAQWPQETTIIQCLKLETDGQHHPHWVKHEACVNKNKNISRQIVYNGAEFSRFWCGQEIQPLHSIAVDPQACSDDPLEARVFPRDASVNGEGMAPMIIRLYGTAAGSEPLQGVECDIPCLEEPGRPLSELIDRRFIEGEPWTILQTMVEGSTNPRASIERTDYRSDNYYSTRSWTSSVPLTYYDFEKYNLRNRPPISFEDAKPRAVYMVSNACNSYASKRHKYVLALEAAGFEVDAMGECNHNTDVPPGKSLDSAADRIAIMKEYRFVLTLDRTTDKDNIPIMVWEALISGSIPVFVGADNVADHLPANSFVSAPNEKWDIMAENIKRINKNKDEWESYHAWRTNEAEIVKFESRYEFSKTSHTCRMCRWGFAKKYGLGWDHASQVVTDTYLPRNLCTAARRGLVSKPFREEWISRSENDATTVKVVDKEEESCALQSESTIDNGSTYKIHRKLTEHDGVVDMLIDDIQRESSQQELVLRLLFPRLHSSDGARFVNSHAAVRNLVHGAMVSSTSIQDDFAKVTVLADWPTNVSCPEDGVVEVVVVDKNENIERPESPLSPNIPRRIRVIVEDMSIIHDKVTEYFPSSFAKKMIKDFVDPLEFFIAG